MNNEKIVRFNSLLQWADAIMVGAASGMSAAAGMNFWYENSPLVDKYLGDFQQKYHFKGIFNGFYTHYPDEETYYAYLTKMMQLIYTARPTKPTYDNLRKLIKDKPYHIMTTNQDALFPLYFPEDNISAIQGDWRYFQSADTSTDENLYNFQPIMDELLPQIKQMRLPTTALPHSPENGSLLIPWVRSYSFLEGEKYEHEYAKIQAFLSYHHNDKIVFLELGVGRMTPMFIQEPFWNLTYNLPQARYININPKDAITHPKIADKSLLIDADINEVLQKVIDLFY